MTSEEPKRSLADDQRFLDSLSDLDHNLTDSPLTTRPAPASAARVPPEGTSPPLSAREPRRLLELFPPTKESVSMPALELIAVPPAERRPPIPYVDPPPPTMPAPQQERRASPPRSYETSYGLDERPFDLVPDLRFLYHSTAHDRSMQSMLDAIRRRDAVVVLTGGLGVGKTILCQAILEQVDRRTLTSLIADSRMSAAQFLKKVLLDFGVISAVDLSKGKLARASRGDLSRAVRDFLETLPGLEAFAVVIVDDAHNLSVDLLGQIRVLVETGEREALLQVILVGELPLAKPELRPLLRRVKTRSTLGPLEADEIGAYVAHRLGVASARPKVAFNDQALLRVHQLSGGLPGVVNLLCDRALAVGQRSSATTINHRMINTAAEELDIAPPASRRSAVYKTAATGLILVLLMLGAVVGALVFRSHVSAWLNRWQQSPAAPSRPALPLPTPYTPTPADAAERAAQDLI